MKPQYKPRFLLERFVDEAQCLALELSITFGSSGVFVGACVCAAVAGALLALATQK